MSSIHFTIYMYVHGYIQRYSIKKKTKPQRLFDTCHHNLNIKVALICSLLVIAVMHIPYKQMHFYTCVRLYKSQEKNNISQFSKYNPI